jgi:hypothetical protein
MMEQMKKRKSQVGKLTPIEHRQKISQTMREKWQDPTYRQKALEGMAKRRGLTIEQFLATKDGNRSKNNNSRATARSLVILKPIKPKQPKIKRSAGGETTMHSDFVDKTNTKAAGRKSSTTKHRITFNLDPILSDSSNVILRVVSPIDIVTATDNSNNNYTDTNSCQHSSTGAIIPKPSTSNQDDADDDDIQSNSITITNNISAKTKTHTVPRRKKMTGAGITKKTKTPTKRLTSVKSKDINNDSDEQSERLREENQKLYKLLYDDEEQDSFLMNEVCCVNQLGSRV